MSRYRSLSRIPFFPRSNATSFCPTVFGLKRMPSTPVCSQVVGGGTNSESKMMMCYPSSSELLPATSEPLSVNLCFGRVSHLMPMPAKHEAICSMCVLSTRSRKMYLSPSDDGEAQGDRMKNCLHTLRY